MSERERVAGEREKEGGRGMRAERGDWVAPSAAAAREGKGRGCCSSIHPSSRQLAPPPRRPGTNDRALVHWIDRAVVRSAGGGTRGRVECACASREARRPQFFLPPPLFFCPRSARPLKRQSKARTDAPSHQQASSAPSALRATAQRAQGATHRDLQTVVVEDEGRVRAGELRGAHLGVVSWGFPLWEVEKGSKAILRLSR